MSLYIYGLRPTKYLLVGERQAGGGARDLRDLPRRRHRGQRHRHEGHRGADEASGP